MEQSPELRKALQVRPVAVMTAVDSSWDISSDANKISGSSQPNDSDHIKRRHRTEQIFSDGQMTRWTCLIRVVLTKSHSCLPIKPKSLHRPDTYSSPPLTSPSLPLNLSRRARCSASPPGCCAPLPSLVTASSCSPCVSSPFSPRSCYYASVHQQCGGPS